MQIWDSKRFSVDSDLSTLSKDDWVVVSLASRSDTFAELLKVEVAAIGSGLQVLRIGKESPLRRLRPLGNLSMQGLVECGDRIVAINGIASRNVGDLERLLERGLGCEITIFDHRTRLTVSWQIHVRGMLEAA